ITLTRGSNSTPVLHDIDHDGDLDLFVGESSGELNFYRNVGTAGDPSFELVSDRFADIDVGRRSFPTFADINGDGNAELFIGSETGEISMYREEFSTAALSFKHDPTFSLSLNNYSTPSLVDIDADGKLDVISGSISGGLIFYHGR
ncbi:MAG: VCBS repeat-containing protein, partial [bacterium]